MGSLKKFLFLFYIYAKICTSGTENLKRSYKETVSASTRPQISRPVCARSSNDPNDESKEAAEKLKQALTCAPNYYSYLDAYQSCEENEYEYTNHKRRRRGRRSAIPVSPSFINDSLPANSSWVLSHCELPTDGDDYTYNMCHICHYTIILPEIYFPRNVSVVTCHAPTSFDGRENYACMSGEGACYENRLNITLKHDTNGSGLENLDNWGSATISFTKSCSCRIIKGNVLSTLV